MKKKMCVIIPIYKKQLSENEKKAVQSYVLYFCKYTLIFIASERLNSDYYEREFPAIAIRRFDNKYFYSNKTYNRLMLNANFYMGFSEYEYMLIAQTDAIIVTPSIDFTDFLDGSFDYIGAPWYTPIIKRPFSIKDFIKLTVIHHPEICSNGNGGFSLRNIDAVIKMLKKDWFYLKVFWWFNEDIYFIYRGQRTKVLRIADRATSERFALEEKMKEQLIKGIKPVALHAWERYFSSYEDLQELLKENLVR